MESIKELFNCEVYKRLDVTTQKDFCICDNEINHIYTDYDLIKVWDYFKIKNSIKLLELLAQEDYRVNDKKVSELSELEALNELNINSGKNAMGYFGDFKNMLLLQVIPVHSLNFEPSNNRILEMDGKKYLNIYFQKDILKKLKPNKDAKFPHIEKLLYNTLGNKKEFYNHFLKHTAFKIKNPSIQLPSHWVIIDNGGTGKTTFMANEIFDKLFEISVITQSDLESNNTHYLHKKQYIFCEEIESFSNNKKLKALTGSKKFTIDEKYKAQFEIINFGTFVIFSNDIKAIDIDTNDRRWNIVGGGKRLVTLDGSWKDSIFASEGENEEFFDNFYQNLNEEIKAFYCYLLALPVTKQEVYKVLDTKFKTNICEISMRSYDSFMKEFEVLGLDSFVNQYFKGNVDNFNRIHTHYNPTGENLGFWIKSNSLYQLYINYCALTSHKPVQHNNFAQRIKNNKLYKKIFLENKVISIDGKKCSCYKFKTEKDEGNTIEPVKVVEMIKK